MILMAIADADYRFIFIDVGSPGADGDMNSFSRTSIGQKILQNDPSLNLPENSPIGGVQCPFFFVADDAFPINNRIMKPYSGRSTKSARLEIDKIVFNYRLSRARRTVENAFGILVMKWGCLRNEFQCKPEKVRVIVAACCALHNYLVKHSNEYIKDTIIDKPTENEMSQSSVLFMQNPNEETQSQPKDSNSLRDHLKRYVNEIDIIPNQQNYAFNQ